MLNQWKIIIIVFALVLFVLSCSKNDIVKPEPEPTPQPYALLVPANFPQPELDTNNPLTKEGIALGRRLFYDVRLSSNNLISCASCHKQQLSFSDGVSLSNIGVSATVLHRHSPALINMAWANNGLFWDGGSRNLESQAFGPISAHDEMAQNLYELIDELNADASYPAQFKAAFNGNISDAKIVKALAQFQRTFISANSRYDKYVRKETGGTLTADELQGLQLVQQKCQGCHQSDLFTDNGFHNNGIDNDFTNNSFEGIYHGRSRITFKATDLGKFKTPTLRNVMLTAPYMHDGRFATIEQVLNHYSSGVLASATTDPLVMQQTGGAAGIPMTTDEKNKIISFLKTLTDSSFITNKSLSNL